MSSPAQGELDEPANNAEQQELRLFSMMKASLQRELDEANARHPDLREPPPVPTRVTAPDVVVESVSLDCGPSQKRPLVSGMRSVSAPSAAYKAAGNRERVPLIGSDDRVEEPDDAGDGAEKVELGKTPQGAVCDVDDPRLYLTSIRARREAGSARTRMGRSSIKNFLLKSRSSTLLRLLAIVLLIILVDYGLEMFYEMKAVSKVDVSEGDDVALSLERVEQAQVRDNAQQLEEEERALAVARAAAAAAAELLEDGASDGDGGGGDQGEEGNDPSGAQGKQGGWGSGGGTEEEPAPVESPQSTGRRDAVTAVAVGAAGAAAGASSRSGLANQGRSGVKGKPSGAKAGGGVMGPLSRAAAGVMEARGLRRAVQGATGKGQASAKPRAPGATHRQPWGPSGGRITAKSGIVTKPSSGGGTPRGGPAGSPKPPAAKPSSSSIRGRRGNGQESESPRRPAPPRGVVAKSSRPTVSSSAVLRPKPVARMALGPVERVPASVARPIPTKLKPSEAGRGTWIDLQPSLREY
eukprot:jgi/Mesvir1/6105/Mv00816-RA.1